MPFAHTPIFKRFTSILPRGRFVIITGLALSLSGAAIAHSGATGIVKERMDRFKASKENIAAIKRHLRAGETKPIVNLADEIADWARQMPDYFPTDSGGKPSEASPKIWLDFNGLTTAAKANEMAALALADSARMGDIKTIMSALKATAKTCKSCHSEFRLD